MKTVVLLVVALLLLACAPTPVEPSPIPPAVLAPEAAAPVCDPAPGEADSQAWVDAMLARVACESQPYADDPWQIVDLAQDPTLACAWACQARACVASVLQREVQGLALCEARK